MAHPVLYLGDTALDRQASYLAAVMAHGRIPFSYVPSHQPLPSSLLNRHWSCMILSDYPSRNLSKKQIQTIIEKVAAGAGLLMIGGWGSFTGTNGRYRKTPLAKALPVIMGVKDDRVNTSNPCLIIKKNNHPILKGFPLSSKLPCVAGFQRLKTRPGATEILSIKVFEANHNGFSLKAEFPLLVLGQYGKGRTAAFASDAAPHWVGGLVDWGRRRVIAQARGGQKIEMGDCYARLFKNIINFTRGI